MADPPADARRTILQRLFDRIDIHRSNVERAAGMLDEEKSTEASSVANGLRRSLDDIQATALTLSD